MSFNYVLYNWKNGVKWGFIGGIFLVSPAYEKEFLIKENALLI